MHLLGLVAACGFSGANCPYRLVCNHEICYLVFRKMKQSFSKLSRYIICLVATFTDRERFAATKNRFDIILKTQIQFGCKHLVVLIKIFTPLTMTNYRV